MAGDLTRLREGLWALGMASGVFRSVLVELPVRPGRRSLALDNPSCALESRLSAEESENRFSGFSAGTRPSGAALASRDQASGICASFRS